jgi:predicted nucleotidyltransferase
MRLFDLRENRCEILEIAAKYGASNVRIFGSVARNEADPSSDIDVLVDLEPGRTLLDHAGLMLDLEQLLDCKVDIAVDGDLLERVRERVLAEAVPL